MRKSRVLVISNNSFSKVFNNGKTLESIFYNTDKDKIAQFYFSELGSTDFEFCSNYFRITEKDIIRSILTFSNDCGQIISRENKDLIQHQKPKKLRKILSKNKNIQLILRNLLWLTKKWNSNNFKEWYINHKPDYLFFVGGPNIFAHKIALTLKKELNVPLVTYFTDDYVVYPSSKGLINSLNIKRIRNIYKKTIAASSLCYCISDKMRKTYTNIYNRNFKVIMNSVSIKPQQPPMNNSNIIKISYLGSLHSGRWQMIIKIAELLKVSEIKFIIDVYCIQKPENAILCNFEKNDINYRGSRNAEELEVIKKESTMLLHVESDEKAFKELTKLSISTKIPEYLIACRPILAFGPKDLASMELLVENNIGFFMDSESDDESNISQIKTFFGNLGNIEKVSIRGYKYALNHFDKVKISKQFSQEINEITNKNKK